MLGWVADLFRLAWGLLYWNLRKSWFRLRRGQTRCPCQSLSDSGRAFETTCEACIHWDRPIRFRRVCPLLVETPDGLRCSADTGDVRPFWGRAARYYGGTFLAVYAAGVIGVFIFLRTIGYPVSILHVGLPPLWYKVGQARGWYFLERSRQAFAAGQSAEGMLYLANSYEFDPTNYEAGIALAKNFQVGQPAHADEVFARLLADHPAKRDFTAEAWFRSLLPRGEFEKITTLARNELGRDSTHASVWMRALFFSCRRTKNDRALRELLANQAPTAAIWHRLIELERLMAERRTKEARLAIDGPWPPRSPAFALFYRVDALIEMKDVIAALDLLGRHPGVLNLEAEATLRLDGFAARGAKATLYREVDELLAPRLEPSTINILCAHLIRHPEQNIFNRFWEKMERATIPFTTETAGAWFSLQCAAGAVGDTTRLHEITARLKAGSKTPFFALNVVESFFRGELPGRSITSFLPILPPPLEVTYALLERYTDVTVPTATAAPLRP